VSVGGSREDRSTVLRVDEADPVPAVCRVLGLWGAAGDMSAMGLWDSVGDMSTMGVWDFVGDTSAMGVGDAAGDISAMSLWDASSDMWRWVRRRESTLFFLGLRERLK
jgi:hypothetical protein